MPGASSWRARELNVCGLFLLRADGSANLGLGHLMRMVTLAKGVGQTGTTAVILVRDDPAAQRMLRKPGLNFEYLPADLSLSDDAEQTKAAASRLGADVIITDVCHALALADPSAFAAYHLALKSSRALVVSFGGAQYVDESADIAVNPYVGADALTSNGSVDQLRLCGPNYFIFRPELLKAAATPRMITRSADRVLVTIGGADPAGLSELALEALASLDLSLRVRIVIGSAFAAGYRRRLERMTPIFGGHIEWLESPPDMAELMLWADVAITGDGLTKYETALTGTPSIMLSRSDSPESMNEKFVEKGTVLHFKPGENAGPTELRRVLEELRKDFRRREEMSRLGKTFLDGRGLERLLSAIEMRRANAQA